MAIPPECTTSSDGSGSWDVRRRAAHVRRTVGGPLLRIGFLRLVDAAPLIVAAEQGYFADEGLHVELQRQIGWANVRDKLAYGHLDASHALVGMPAAAAAAAGASAGGTTATQGDPLLSVCGLGRGGDAITLSSRLASLGINSAGTLGRWVRQRRRGVGLGDVPPLTFAHVFGCSTQHFLLRDWLAWAGLGVGDGVSAPSDVRLCIIPPPQVADHLASGHLDGFCVGEPWNTLAAGRGAGVVLLPTSDLMPDHPEKVLAVTRRWATTHGDRLLPLVRATLRGCRWCDEASHDSTRTQELAGLLARREYLNLPAEAIRASLTPRLPSPGMPVPRPTRSFAPAAMFPSATDMAWVIEQMARWGLASGRTDVRSVAATCVDSRAFRLAADTMGVPCPPDDFPPLPLARGGAYEAPAGMSLAVA